MTTETATTTDIEYDETEAKREALAAFLKCDRDDVTESDYGDDYYQAEGGEYLVLTDEQADDRTTEYIKESLWAFNASFLAGFTGLPEAMFTAIQPQCEGANDAILQVIEQGDGLKEFVEQAVGADGRGHFLSTYDSEENEQGDFYIYRTN